MKKHIYALLFLLVGLVSFAQKPIEDIKSSPNGCFDKVFDQYGNRYELKDLQVVENTKEGQAFSKNTLISCDSGIFELYFETGSGMDNTSDAANNQRRDVVCRVFKDISNFIRTNNATTTKVRIWVRDITKVQNVPSTALGVATSFYTAPYNTAIGFGGIIDGEIYKTIQGGKDSYTNTSTPLVTTDGASNGSGLFYHGMLAFNFSNINWNTNLLATSTTGQYDLYTVVLHEVTHALGFNSLLRNDGKSVFGDGFKYYSRYDRFLKSNTGTQILTTASACTAAMYNYNFSLDPAILQPNTNNCTTDLIQPNCANTLKFVGTNNTVPVYTPNCYEQGSSFSHFEDWCKSTNPGNNTYFVMSNSNNIGVQSTKRYLKTEERNALMDIGYSLNTTYGNNSTAAGSYYSYGGTAPAINNIAGINDGITSTGTYSYTGNTYTQINISGILGNDFNATSFECLEDVFDNTSTISSTTGTTSTSINFYTTTSGLHLLRYVPISPTGKKGNITYVYVYTSAISNCATANSCNLVINGDFEQYSTVPDNISQITRACGWNNPNTATPDYYHENANYYPTSTIDNDVRIPCNRIGTQTVANNIGKAYAGLASVQGAGGFKECIYTRLASPLAPNTTYQLTFDISLAEGNSALSYKIQAFLTQTSLQHASNAYTVNIPDPDNTIPLKMEFFSNKANGWKKGVINFTTGATAGEQFLYIGSIKDVNYQTETPSTAAGCNYVNINDANTSYYYIDNISLIPTNGSSLNLPISICINDSLNNLTSYLSGVPTTGTFSGLGVSSNTFNSTVSGVGPHTITYTYTNSSGCSVSISDTILVNSLKVPTFNQVNSICTGATLNPLPTTSTNGVTGIWSPALNNTATTTYTFTPNAGQCSATQTMTIVVNQTITPSFNNIAPICAGTTLSPLPTTSTNGVAGTWSPALNNTATTTYTFTPNAGQCATTKTMTIVVNPMITATFNSITPVCSGTTLSPLPTTSTNGVTGTWSPTLNNTVTTTYTFTPNTGQCSTAQVNLTIVVNPNVTPTFNSIAPICSGTANPLQNVSNNDISGSWSPAFNNTATTTYTFTPNPGQCATTSSITIVVNQSIIPEFDEYGIICSGETLPALPTTSNNGITGTWSPAMNNTATTTYTFTPSAGQCATTQTMTVIVEPRITPTFESITPICHGTTTNPFQNVSNNGIPGSWSPVFNNTVTTTYTFTPDTGQCATTTTMTITILASNDPNCSENVCVPTLTLSNPEAGATGTSHTYNVTTWIECNNDYDVNGQIVNLYAGKRIVLKPDTYIHGKSEFLAKIQTCPEDVYSKTNELVNVTSSITVYPNPTLDFFTINSSETNLKSVEIMSIEGKVIFTRYNLNGNSLEIDFSKYQNGIYIANITTIDNKVISQKIIKN